MGRRPPRIAVIVVNGDSTVMASWTAPSIGPVTSYTATVSPGGASCTTASLGCAINGLTDGVAYSAHRHGDQRRGHGSRVGRGDRRSPTRG